MKIIFRSYVFIYLVYTVFSHEELFPSFDFYYKCFNGYVDILEYDGTIVNFPTKLVDELRKNEGIVGAKRKVNELNANRELLTEETYKLKKE